MKQMEEGTINNRENYIENVCTVAICNESIDDIIPDEAVQPEIINPKVHFQQDECTEIDEDISTMSDSKKICQKIISDIIEDIAQDDDSEAFCQSILLDILEEIEKMLPSQDDEVGTNNQILNDNLDEILLIHVEEIFVEEFPSMQEKIVQEGEWFLGLSKHCYELQFRAALNCFISLLDFIKDESSIPTTSKTITTSMTWTSTKCSEVHMEQIIVKVDPLMQENKAQEGEQVFFTRINLMLGWTQFLGSKLQQFA